MRIALLIVTVAVVVGGLYGLYRIRSPGELAVRFVVPDGYRGIFRLVVDPAADAGVTQENGVWVYRIPDGGVLKIRRHRPLSEWHRPSAVYRGGESLAAAQSPPAEPLSNEIRVHSAGSASGPDGAQTIDYFVGSDRQMLEILKLVDRPLGSAGH